MIGVRLAVDPRNAVIEHYPRKMRERALARIRHAGEHRFAEEARTEGNPVKSTDKLSVLPGLEGMGKAKPVEFAIPRLKIARNPGAVLTRTRHHGTLVNHFRKRRIHPILEEPFLENLLERLLDPEILRLQHETRIGRKPRYVEAKTGSNTGDYYELTKNGEIYTYAYTAVDKDKDTSTTTTYIAKEADDGETIKVEYLDDKNTSDETDDEFIEDVDATVYWLYAENAQDGDAPLYYQPNTIGALQDGKDISSIAKHLTIKELVGEADDSRLFSTIGDWKMSDLQNQEMIMSLKVEEVIEIKDSDSGLLKAMRNWTLADLSKQENIDSLKIAEIIDIKDNSDENPSPKVLQYIADPDGDGDTSNSWTLGDLNSGKFYDLKLDQIIDITAHSDNVVLSHLKDVAVGDLAHEMTKLTFSKLFADEIFVKVLDDGAGNYTFFVDKNGSNTFESEEDKKITDEALIAKFTDGLEGTNNPEIRYSLEPIQENGVTVAYFLYTDRPTYNEETGLTQTNGIADGDEYVIGDHIWWYLLHNQKHCDDDHASGDKQCYVDYTVDDLASLIENMQTNVETATLYTLEEDGLVSFGTRLDGTSILDDDIRENVGDISVDFLVQGADTIGDLTVKQLTDYIFKLVIAIDAYEYAVQNGYVG